MHLAQRFGAREFAKKNLKKKRSKFPWKKAKTNRQTKQEHDLSVTTKFKSRIKANNNQMSTNAVVLYRTSRQIRALEKQIQELELEAGNIKRQLSEKEALMKPREKRLNEQKKLISRHFIELDDLRSANSETYYFGESTHEEIEGSEDSDENNSETVDKAGKKSCAAAEPDFSGVELHQVWYSMGFEFGRCSAQQFIKKSKKWYTMHAQLSNHI